jgi:hypothetical protein
VSSRRICYRADEPATGVLCVRVQRGLCWAGEPPGARNSLRSPAWQSLPVAGLANPLPCRCRLSSAPAFSIKSGISRRDVNYLTLEKIFEYGDPFGPCAFPAASNRPMVSLIIQPCGCCWREHSVPARHVSVRRGAQPYLVSASSLGAPRNGTAGEPLKSLRAGASGMRRRACPAKIRSRITQ